MSQGPPTGMVVQSSKAEAAKLRNGDRYGLALSRRYITRRASALTPAGPSSRESLAKPSTGEAKQMTGTLALATGAASHRGRGLARH